jgi:hypothetical protein
MPLSLFVGGGLMHQPGAQNLYFWAMAMSHPVGVRNTRGQTKKRAVASNSSSRVESSGRTPVRRGEAGAYFLLS